MSKYLNLTYKLFFKYYDVKYFRITQYRIILDNDYYQINEIWF